MASGFEGMDVEVLAEGHVFFGVRLCFSTFRPKILLMLIFQIANITALLQAL